MVNWLSKLTYFNTPMELLKNKIVYDHIKFDTITNLPSKKKEALELGKKIINSDKGLKSIEFILSYVSFLDDEVGPNKAIDVLKDVIDSDFENKETYIIRFYWDLAIIASSSGNWILAKENFENFKKLNFFKILDKIKNPSLKNFYLSSISNFSWVDYNIYLCDLALKNFSKPSS